MNKLNNPLFPEFNFGVEVGKTIIKIAKEKGLRYGNSIRKLYLGNTVGGKFTVEQSFEVLSEHCDTSEFIEKAIELNILEKSMFLCGFNYPVAREFVDGINFSCLRG